MTVPLSVTDTPPPAILGRGPSAILDSTMRLSRSGVLRKTALRIEERARGGKRTALLIFRWCRFAKGDFGGGRRERLGSVMVCEFSAVRRGGVRGEGVSAIEIQPVL